MLYAVHENIKQSYKPISNVLEVVLKNLEFYEKFFHETPLSNLMQAQSTFLYQLIKDYPKPHFNYKPIEKEGLTYNVLEEVVKDKTFCEFKKKCWDFSISFGFSFHCNYHLFPIENFRCS